MGCDYYSSSFPHDKAVFQSNSLFFMGGSFYVCLYVRVCLSTLTLDRFL
jgi:hypothetical protein